MNRKTFIKNCMGAGYSRKDAEAFSKTITRWGSYDAAWLFGVANKRGKSMSVSDRVRICGQAERALKRGSITARDVDFYMDYAAPFHYPDMSWAMPKCSRVQMEKITGTRTVSRYVLQEAVNEEMADWIKDREKEELLRNLVQYAKKWAVIESCEAWDGIHYRATLWVGKETTNENKPVV